MRISGNNEVGQIGRMQGREWEECLIRFAASRTGNSKLPVVRAARDAYGWKCVSKQVRYACC